MQRPVRAVINWNTDPAFIDYANRPSADLDLQIISPTGSIVATSASLDNTYEIVQFTPPVTGTYPDPRDQLPLQPKPALHRLCLVL